MLFSLYLYVLVKFGNIVTWYSGRRGAAARCLIVNATVRGSVTNRRNKLFHHFLSLVTKQSAIKVGKGVS